jgi:hypothetical protein
VFTAHCATTRAASADRKARAVSGGDNIWLRADGGGDGRSWGGAVAPLVAHAGGEVIRHTKKPLSEASVGGFPDQRSQRAPDRRRRRGAHWQAARRLVEWLMRSRKVDSADVEKRTSRAHTFG